MPSRKIGRYEINASGIWKSIKSNSAALIIGTAIKLHKVTSDDGNYICLDNLTGRDRKDHFADMFVQWLNQSAILGRRDWKYAFLDDDFFSDAGTLASAINIQTMARCVRGRDLCETPKYSYRRNRYQQLEH